MRNLVKFILLIVALMLLTVPMVLSAQEESGEPSSGCMALDGFSGSGTVFSFDAQSFYTGEVLIFAQPAGEFEIIVTDSGEVVESIVDVPGVVVYVIPADGEYTFSIEVVDGTDMTGVEVFCFGGTDEVKVSDLTGGTICHIPPGNPSNAHTINVGGGAVAAHLRHGDTLGACDDGVDTKVEDVDAEVTIFVMPEDGFIHIYGDCDDDDNCVLIILIDIAELEPIEDGEFEFDVNPDDEYTVVVYYLHKLTDGDNEDEGEDEDSGIYVYQVNIYKNDTLISDKLLLLINEEGEIVAWTTHDMWNNLEEVLAAFDLDE